MQKPDVLAICATEYEIISKIKAGEKDYFEILIRIYNSAIYKVGRSYGFSHDYVQDLMQETHISAFQSLDKFEEKAAYKTWIVRIMLNKCYHWSQKLARKTGQTFSEATSTGLPFPMESVPFSDARKEILNRELGLVLEKCIEQLSMEYRTVFVLRELEGLNVQETAEAMGITEVNVKIRLSRAKNMFRKQLENWYPQAQVYEFNLIYCDQIVEQVFNKI